MSDVDSGRTPAADKARAAIAEVERLLEAAQRRAALPGFDPAELATEPRELVIRSKRERGERNSSGTPDSTAHRPAALPPFFRPETAKATLHNGVLTLIARKAAGTVVPPPDGRAAP